MRIIFYKLRDHEFKDAVGLKNDNNNNNNVERLRIADLIF